MKQENVQAIVFAFREGMDLVRGSLEYEIEKRQKLSRDNEALLSELHKQIGESTELKKKLHELAESIKEIGTNRSVSLSNQITELDNAYGDLPEGHPRKAAIKCAVNSLEMLNEISMSLLKFENI